MNKRVVRYLIVVFGIVSILFALVKVIGPSKNIKRYLVMGDYLSVNRKVDGKEIASFTSLLGEYFVDNNLIDEINSSYAFSGVDSSKLLEMIEKDAYSGKDDGLVSLIKESKYITVSVGMNDIIEYIKFDSSNKKVVYDKEFIKRKMEIMKQNYLEIVEEIKQLNEGVSVYLIGYYSPLEYEEEVFNMLNDSIKQVSELCNVYYVDISGVNEYEDMFQSDIYLNSLGQEYVFEIFKKNYLVN